MREKKKHFNFPPTQIVFPHPQTVELAPRRSEQVRANRDSRLEDEYPPGGSDPAGAGRGRDASRPDIPKRGDRIPLSLCSHGKLVLCVCVFARVIYYTYIYIRGCIEAQQQLRRARGRRLLENQ